MHTAEPETTPAAGYGPTLSLALAMLLAALGTSIANIALPGLAAAFAAPFPRVQGVVVAYLAGLTGFALVAGRLGDRFGRRRMLTGGLILFALASAACGMAPDIGSLTAARAAQGAAAAFLMTLAIALVHDAAGEARIGRAMGLLGTMSAAGTALGPTLGGFLMAAWDWRAVFLVLAPAGLIAALATVALLPPDGPAAKAPQQRPTGFPAGDLMAGLGANFLVAAVMMATLLVGPFYLGRALGLPAAWVGLVMSAGPVLAVACGIPSGRLVDRRGPGPVARLGLGALLAGAVALVMLPAGFGLPGYVAAIATLTPGYQLFLAANNTALMSFSQPGRRGTVSGLLNLSRNLGLIFGASVMGAVFALGTGTAEIALATPEAVARGMQTTFVVAALLILAALRLSPADRQR